MTCSGTGNICLMINRNTGAAAAAPSSTLNIFSPPHNWPGSLTVTTSQSSHTRWQTEQWNVHWVEAGSWVGCDTRQPISWNNTSGHLLSPSHTHSTFSVLYNNILLVVTVSCTVLYCIVYCTVLYWWSLPHALLALRWQGGPPRIWSVLWRWHWANRASASWRWNGGRYCPFTNLLPSPPSNGLDLIIRCLHKSWSVVWVYPGHLYPSSSVLYCTVLYCTVYPGNLYCMYCTVPVLVPVSEQFPLKQRFPAQCFCLNLHNGIFSSEQINTTTSSNLISFSLKDG